MRQRLFVVLMLLLALATGYFVGARGTRYFRTGAVPVGIPTPAPAGEGWIDLLDKSNVSKWRNITDDEPIFEIQDNVLHIFGRTIYPLRYVAYTGTTFGDFELHLEVKVAQGTNSGVFVRAQQNDPVQRGFEIQVLDDFGEPPNKKGTGAIYDVATPMFNMARPAGEWNSYDISLQGRVVEVRVNGWLVVKTDLSKMKTPVGKFRNAYAELPLEGMLMLQDHGGEAWYRNILLRPIPSTGAAAPAEQSRDARD